MSLIITCLVPKKGSTFIYIFMSLLLSCTPPKYIHSFYLKILYKLHRAKFPQSERTYIKDHTKLAASRCGVGTLPQQLHKMNKSLSEPILCYTEFVEQASEANESTSDLTSVSLAYYDLEMIPRRLIDHLRYETATLDLSYNEFKDLSFLTSFKRLKTLILDRNPYLDITTFPCLPNLEILWLNNCNIINTTTWLYMLQIQCPGLKQLSMICNPVGATTMNGVTAEEEKQYRKEIAEILPSLIYFDGVQISDTERGIPTDNVILVKIKKFNEKIRKLFQLES